MNEQINLTEKLPMSERRRDCKLGTLWNQPRRRTGDSCLGRCSHG